MFQETEIDDNNRKMAEQNEKLENAKAEWQTAKSKLEEAQAVVREKKTEERTANAAFVERQKEVDQLTGQKNRCRNNTEMKRRALGIVQNDLEKATGAVAAKRQEKDVSHVLIDKSAFENAEQLSCFLETVGRSSRNLRGGDRDWSGLQSDHW